MIKYLALSSCFLLLLSCEKEVSVALPEIESQLVVNALLVEGSAVKLYLSHSKMINDSSSAQVSNARISFYQDDQLVDSLSETEQGVYTGTFIIQANHLYQANIQTDQYPEIWVKDSVVSKPDIPALKRVTIGGYYDNGYYYSDAKITVNDPFQTEDFYEIVLYRINSENGKTGILSIFSNDDPVILNEGLPFIQSTGFPFSDEELNGLTKEISVNYNLMWTFYLGDSTVSEEYDPQYRLIIEVRKTSKAYYLFRRSVILQVNGKFPDFWNGLGNPSSLYSNVDNGLGIFAGYSFVRDTLDRP